MTQPKAWQRASNRGSESRRRCRRVDRDSRGRSSRGSARLCRCPQARTWSVISWRNCSFSDSRSIVCGERSFIDAPIGRLLGGIIDANARERKRSAARSRSSVTRVIASRSNRVEGLDDVVGIRRGDRRWRANAEQRLKTCLTRGVEFLHDIRYEEDACRRDASSASTIRR